MFRRVQTLHRFEIQANTTRNRKKRFDIVNITEFKFHSSFFDKKIIQIRVLQQLSMSLTFINSTNNTHELTTSLFY